MRSEPKPDAFAYSLRISQAQRYNIIRFPSDTEIYARLLADASSRVAFSEAFHAITKTRWEISVIQNATYPPCPESLNEYLERAEDFMQKEEGFVLIQVVPAKGSKIDFGMGRGGIQS